MVGNRLIQSELFRCGFMMYYVFILLMKSLVLICLLLIQLPCFMIKTDQEGQLTIQRIPSYLGKSYHLLRGNPFTDRVDPGFKQTIFQFSFDKGLTTDDKKYQIADHTHSSDTTSCSLQSSAEEYSGTKNYQKELSSVTEVDARYSELFLSASFTFSLEFSQFSNSTQTEKRRITQSNAHCEVYTVDMPVYSNDVPLTKDFQEGVKDAFSNNNWKEFVNDFGTHYAHKVIFGGRYVLQHQYSEKSMSYFTSMNIDVRTAARVQFANMFSLNMSQDLKRYQNQTNVANSKVENVKKVMIGGQPPRSGSWIDWERTVKDNLAPISYELTALTMLFNFIPNLNATKAIASFNSYLENYCKTEKCPDVSPDRPAPKPLKVSFKQSQEIHGSSMSKNTFNTLDGGIKVGMRVFKVLMGTEGDIDSIQFFFTDGVVEHISPKAGSRNFNQEYNVPKGDEIKCVRLGIKFSGSEWQFSSMQFITRNKIESAVYKGTFAPNEYRELCVQSEDDHFVGFYGHFGVTFDGIGFNVMTELFQP